MSDDHGRSKYKRRIQGLENNEELHQHETIIDVYCVLEAFNVTCPARAHAVKKLLCAGLRGKGDALKDLMESRVALDRAIDLEKNRCRSHAK